MTVGTHSLRKGGAHWYTHVAGLSEDIVQAQGGWSSLEVLRAVYSKHTEQERKALTLDAVSNVPIPSRFQSV